MSKDGDVHFRQPSGFFPIQKAADVDLYATQVMNQDAYTSLAA